MDPPDGRDKRLIDRSTAVFTVSIVSFALATAFVTLRLLSRAWVVKKVGLDDYCIAFAWCLGFGLTFTNCYSAWWGLGRHESEIPNQWQGHLRESIYAFTILYQPSLMAVKSSILVFYLTLPTSRRIFKWACIATLFVVNAGGISLTLVTALQCRSPISAAYAPFPVPGSVCTDILTIYLSSVPLNIITDLAIMFLPFPILTGMRLPKKTKIILVITFSFGIFVAAVDVVRVAYLQSASAVRLQEIQSQTSSGSRPEDRTDFSWYASFSFMWSVIEVNVGMMIACVPAMKPLVARFIPHLLKDPGEVTSKSLSDSPSPLAVPDAGPNILPMMPEHVHRRDFGMDEKAGAEDSHDAKLDMLEFLSGPKLHRTSTALTNTTRHTKTNSSTTFFDFVNMNGTKSMVHMTNRESIFPIAMVTVLFFIWGFEYGLIDVLNSAFQQVSGMTSGQGAAIHSAYFAGYLVGPLTVGRVVLKRWGFSACYTVGLAIYGCGTLIYWPAAVLTSFPAFILTNFVVGFGLSLLEVAANPFISLCGPAEYAEVRLNLSQGMQAVGSIVAPLIATRAFYRDLNAPSLINTQWAYLGISLATILLAVGYYYIPLPEATDDELEEAAQRIDRANLVRFGRFRIIWYSLALGSFGIFFYVGGQEVVSTSFQDYVAVLSPGYDPVNMEAIAHTAFAISRFTAAGLGMWIRPRILMVFFFVGSIIFTALAMNYEGPTGMAFIIIVFFMEGPLFALIFAQTLRGMGRHTKTASVIITASISGSAVLSPISSYLANETPRGPGFGLIVAVAAFSIGIFCPILASSAPAMRKLLDPIQDATSVSTNRPDGRMNSRTGHALSFILVEKKEQIKLGVIRERKPDDMVLNTHGFS